MRAICDETRERDACNNSNYNSNYECNYLYIDDDSFKVQVSHGSTTATKSKSICWASAESLCLESHRNQTNCHSNSEKRVLTVALRLELIITHTHILTLIRTYTLALVLWMNTHAGRARLKVGCAGFYVAPDHLAIPIWIWILISIFVWLNVDSLRVSAKRRRRRL